MDPSKLKKGDVISRKDQEFPKSNTIMVYSGKNKSFVFFSEFHPIVRDYYKNFSYWLNEKVRNYEWNSLISSHDFFVNEEIPITYLHQIFTDIFEAKKLVRKTIP
jgi:hypothetical protein